MDAPGDCDAVEWTGTANVPSSNHTTTSSSDGY